MSGLTGSVTAEEQEGHTWLKLPFPLLLRGTEHCAVSTCHGLMQLLDQVPASEHTTAYILPLAVHFPVQMGGLGGTRDTITDLTQPLLAMTSAWLSLRTSPESKNQA